MIHGYKEEECLANKQYQYSKQNITIVLRIAEIPNFAMVLFFLNFFIFCYGFKINHEFTIATGDKTNSFALNKALRQRSQLLSWNENPE